MDALRKDDLESSRVVSPTEKLAQALELMETGLLLKREAIERSLPDADEEAIERALEAWLFSNG